MESGTWGLAQAEGRRKGSGPVLSLASSIYVPLVAYMTTALP